MSQVLTPQQPMGADDAEWQEFYEIVDGERVELPPMAAFEINLASVLCRYLGLFADERSLGRAVTEMLFVLRAEPKLQRRPDTAFVSYDRWPAKRRVPRTNAWDVVPELTVEINSRTNLADDIPLRVREYFEAGVKRHWLIFPSASLVYQYDADSPNTIRVLTRGDELDGGTILPGFRLPLATVFGNEEDDSESAQ